MAKFGKNRSGPWYADEKSRLIFERRVTEFFPDLKRRPVTIKGERGLGYRVTVNVPFYESRVIDVLFYPRVVPGSPVVLADGPTESPHRYPDFERRQLCIWYPNDPPEAKWIWEDGLLHLLGLTKLHLFREAWWRETGEWLGPQAPHVPRDKLERSG